MRFVFAVLMSLMVAGCSATQVLNDLSSSAGQTATRGIAYGPDPREALDVYAPAGASGAPTVVFFYGGSWQSGDRADYAFVGRALAAQGIVAVVPDYRLYPQVGFTGFMSDAARATAWAKRHARDYGGDPNRLVVMGHSAGAHIAVLLTLDRHWLAAEHVDVGRAIAGTVGLAGPYDFLPLTDPVLKAVFGPPVRLADTQPINFVDGRNPPMFLATDADDKTVDPRNTQRLADKVRRLGGPVTTRVYPGLSHTTLIGVMSEPLSGLATVRGDVTAFVRALPASKQ